MAASLRRKRASPIRERYLVETSYASHSAPSNAGLRSSYDREAPQYDLLRYQSREGRLFSDLEVSLLRSWLMLRAGDRLLDLPAGTGRLSLALADTGAKIVAADISANMLQMAASKGKTGSVAFTQGSGSELPFADDTFDAVISFKFFHLVPNERKPAFIQEMRRVLKPGKSLVVEFNSPFYGGLLAAFRYYFRKKHPGGMRMKCIFPDQIKPLFQGFDVTRVVGLKLPLAGALARLIGTNATERLDSWFGRLPGAKYLAYVIIVEARKRAAQPQSARGYAN
jgi:ubiquinone/menaquinone biosynthesis C-methylase UbiE